MPKKDLHSRGESLSHDVAATSRTELFCRHVLSSGVPAVLWTVVGCPFDVIKTRMQTATTRTQNFSGPFHCLSWTVRRDGFTALYRGFLPQLLLSTPYSIIMFGTYQALKPTIPKESESKTIGSRSSYLCGCILAGAFSGVTVTAIHNPLEFWRVQVQTHLPLYNTQKNDGGVEKVKAKTQHRSNRTILRKMIFQPRQLGRGTSMTLAENVVGNAVYFGSNEAMRQEMIAKKDESWISEFLIGGITGAVFQLIVYPIDLVKARLMTTKSNNNNTARQIARQIVHEDGFRGFYRGSSVAITRSFVINAAGLPALRIVQKWLDIDA